jgi:hypothetical protein
MGKKRIDELAEDPRFIPGIYSYCDRWCERCALTSWCMSRHHRHRERSIAAWAALLTHFPDPQDRILNLLATLKALLRQAEASFPNARAFLRPGFDATD